jgi:hypothetical protein
MRVRAPLNLNQVDFVDRGSQNLLQGRRSDVEMLPQESE